MRKEVEEDSIGQPAGKAKRCPCRTREEGVGQAAELTAAARCLEDWEEDLPHRERGKRSVD